MVAFLKVLFMEGNWEDTSFRGDRRQKCTLPYGHFGDSYFEIQPTRLPHDPTGPRVWESSDEQRCPSMFDSHGLGCYSKGFGFATCGLEFGV